MGSKLNATNRGGNQTVERNTRTHCWLFRRICWQWVKSNATVIFKHINSGVMSSAAHASVWVLVKCDVIKNVLIAFLSAHEARPISTKDKLETCKAKTYVSRLFFLYFITGPPPQTCGEQCDRRQTQHLKQQYFFAPFLAKRKHCGAASQRQTTQVLKQQETQTHSHKCWKRRAGLRWTQTKA